MPRDHRDIVIGKIVGAFGIRGELKVVALTEFPERFATGKSVALNTAKGRQDLKIESSRPHGGGVLLKLQGIDTRGDAESVRATEIVIAEAELGELNEGSFYLFDIIGLKVVTDDCREQGEVTEILQGSGNDVYFTSTGLCIPALKNVVTKIDLENGVMIIHPVPGLLPDE